MGKQVVQKAGAGMRAELTRYKCAAEVCASVCIVERAMA